MQEKQEQQIEIVAPSTDKVMCDGGTGDLGHPAVYFKIDKNKEKRNFTPTGGQRKSKKISV